MNTSIPELSRDTLRSAPVKRLCATLLSSLALGAAWHGPAAAQDAALSKAAAEKGAVVTASGLVFSSRKAGTGDAPKASDTVRVHYRGRFPGGKEFDSSYGRGEPASFPLNRVIKCWTEGLQLMKVGGQAKLTCPAAIAYGDRAAGGGMIPPGSVLEFEVELLAITAP